EAQLPIDESIEPEKLFQYDYTTRLVNLTASHEDSLIGIRDIENHVKDLFELNDHRRKQLEELNDKLEIEKANRERIIGNSSLGASKLTDVLKNYNAWQESLKSLNKDVVGYEKDLDTLNQELKAKKIEKENIDLATASNFLIKTRAILRDIETI